nr:MAG TPA: hypothetical protein [Caudoviricetes sp.]
MQELTDFMGEAWRTLTDSFVLKALHVFPFLTITLRGSEWIY